MTYEFGHLPVDAHPNHGDLEVGDGTIAFLHEAGPGSCGGTGKYHYAINGDQVTFQVAQDFCNVRVKQTVSEPYLRCASGSTSCGKPAN